MATKKAKKSGLDKLHKKLDDVKKAPRRQLLIPGMAIECCFEKDAISGSLHMTFGDTNAEVTLGDKKLGSISACLGGGVEVRIDGYTYFIGYTALWDAVASAHKEWTDNK